MLQTKFSPTLAALGAAALLGLAVHIGDWRDMAFGMGRIVSILISTGIGFAIGWFFSPQAKALRRVLLIGLAALMLFFAVGGPRGLADGMASFLAMVGFFVGLGYWLAQRARGFFEKPTTFGSAEWATEEHLRENNLIGDTGIRIGEFMTKDGPLPLHYSGGQHILNIAPTGSGKGTTFIIPNLLSYGDAESGSVIVIDPKGENAMITADARRRMGQRVHIVDPWGIASSAGEAARFNPLDWLVVGDPDITENAMLLADALVVNDGKGDSFWVEEAKALLHGLILYVATDEEEASNRHLGRVRDLLMLDGDGLQALFARMYQSMHHVVATTGARCLQKEDRLLANVLASAQAQTHFLDSPRIRASLAASDFKFEDLKTGAVTVYLVLPADRLQTFGRWLRPLIQQAITVNARNIELRPAKPVLFILDEMPALGRLTMVEQAFAVMRGYSMALIGICQDTSQLEDIYGKRWESFVSNSACTIYGGSRDRNSADYFSALCGVTTVWSLSTAFARSTGFSGNQSNSSTSTTETTSHVQRKLAFPDELMRIPAGKQLVFVENCNPIIGVKRPWFADNRFATLGRNLRLEGPAQ